MTWQPASVLYPDIELELTGRFRAALAASDAPYASDVFVSNRVPNPRRNRMVILRRDGGTQVGLRDRPRVAIRVWAADGEEQDADDLARLVMALAPSFADGDPILAVPTEGRSGPYSVPDESGQPLRYMNVEFHTRGVPL